MILLADIIDDLEAGLPKLVPPHAPYNAAAPYPVPEVCDESEVIPEMGTSA
jgi:hypothetical protein